MNGRQIPMEKLAAANLRVCAVDESEPQVRQKTTLDASVLAPHEDGIVPEAKICARWARFVKSTALA